MKAILRLGLGFAAAALAAAVPVHAQDSAQDSNSSTTIGPAEIQNFSINGTVTTPAPAQDQPRAQPNRPRPAAPTDRPAPAPTTTATVPADRPSTASPAPTSRVAEAQPRAVTPAPPAPPQARDALRQTPRGGSVTVELPKIDGDGSATAEGALPSDFGTPNKPFALMPWLLALVAAGLAVAFLIYQRRARPAYAGDVDQVYFEPAPAPTAPKPVARAIPAPEAPAPPAPRPDPIPAKPADDHFVSFVSTRLRPWLELEFRPIKCTVNDDMVAIEFEIEVENRGNAPARAVLIEARLVNAGENQDGEINAFFANPVGQGDRIPSIEPLKRIQLRSQLVATRDQVQVYEVGGRSVFVPLVAFNTLYEWARGQGQTSLSYLVGRDTKSDKLAPFRLDLGPRLFRTLDKRPLPIEVRH